MLLSDLEVHREQATKQTAYFERSNNQDLESKLFTIWKAGDAGPNLEDERQARAKSVLDQQRFARNLIKLARNTIRFYNGEEQSVESVQYLLKKILS